jgi:seryl-tRNA synthetase
MTDRAPFLRELLDAGLLIESGVRGVYGHGAGFEDVRAAFERLIGETAAARGAERLRFPPLLPREQLEDSEYLGSFPHLAGTVFEFGGDERDARTQGERAAAHEDWSEFQRMTDLTLLPAACYPVYPAIASRGRLPPGGAFIEAGGAWVFRREPSDDPARRQIFHQHELVRIGEPEIVRSWRDEWAELGLDLLRRLGLDAQLDIANDPFFGRGARMLAASQRQQALKMELLVPMNGGGPVAMASFNHHQEHFGSRFGIELSDGTTAHTACVGFGHERIVLGMLYVHGLEPQSWPESVRRELWPA